jgi:hypothetical protein
MLLAGRFRITIAGDCGLLVVVGSASGLECFRFFSSQRIEGVQRLCARAEIVCLYPFQKVHSLFLHLKCTTFSCCLKILENIFQNVWNCYRTWCIMIRRLKIAVPTWATASKTGASNFTSAWVRHTKGCARPRIAAVARKRVR